MKKLIELAEVLRSKNAGPLQITFDIIFNTKTMFEAVIQSGVLNKEIIAELYNVRPDEVIITEYAIVNSIKVTIPRTIISGDVKDTDIYGCQQHIPLANLMVPLTDTTSNSSLEVQKS